MDLKNTEKLVNAILFYNPETRDSDDLLYLKIIEWNGLDNTNVRDFFKNRAKTQIPPFETVRRTRQKVQAANPELRGSKRVEKERIKLQQTYKEYALKEN